MTPGSERIQQIEHQMRLLTQRIGHLAFEKQLINDDILRVTMEHTKLTNELHMIHKAHLVDA